MDGLTLIRQVKRIKAEMPVIIITGFSSEATAIEAVNLGVAGLSHEARSGSRRSSPPRRKGAQRIAPQPVVAAPPIAEHRIGATGVVPYALQRSYRPDQS